MRVDGPVFPRALVGSAISPIVYAADPGPSVGKRMAGRPYRVNWRAQRAQVYPRSRDDPCLGGGARGRSRARARGRRAADLVRRAAANLGAARLADVLCRLR